MLCVLAFISFPHRPHYYLLPLEGVRGVEFVTYSDVINIGLPLGKDGLGFYFTTFLPFTIYKPEGSSSREVAGIRLPLMS